ncbi:MAG TPA: hypothetical protein PLN05_17515 [Pyrinomonadaceae bacterium]|nr:hypothetical protein [Pyrinomonadaceae bacterium]HRK52220.1 hypothetical protein [Pyrinomonadaceae bacterium]
MKVKRITGVPVLLLLVCALSIGQTTAFNFQGRLNDGSSPANGRYDLQFKLFDSITGGSQVGASVDRPNLLLINGVFSTTLDFGSSAFTAGDRFVEISVRPNGSPNAHVVLGARQQILSVPFAVRSANATSADTASNAANAQNAQFSEEATNANRLGGELAGEFVRRNVPVLGTVTATILAANQGLSVQGSASLQGNVSVGGRITQPLISSYGVPKAMLEVNEDAGINRCYNGVTGDSTPPCGFTVTQPGGPVGVYRISFGFSVADRFAQITPGNLQSPYRNWGANYRFIAPDFLEVFCFRVESPNDTFTNRFIVILY